MIKQQLLINNMIKLPNLSHIKLTVRISNKKIVKQKCKKARNEKKNPIVNPISVRNH